ncbi:MAG: leucine-rich repeat protein [Ruminococcus sp.]|nr:leucine-rich repeat protein [Ruminococcus sp.]
MKKPHLNIALISLSLLLVFAFSVIPVLAATYVQDGDWKYEYSELRGEYFVEEYLGNNSRVAIPSLFQSKHVSKVNNAAFMDNKVIEYIEFPATLREIEMNAFYGCTSIKSLIITSELEVIGDNAFYGCNSIGSIIFENNTSLKSIPANCFNRCSTLTTVSISQGVESIGNYAFNMCSKLSVAIIPASVTSISETAFSKCDNLTIYGWEDTCAQQYAMDNEIPFISFGTYVEPTEKPTETEPASTETEPVVTTPSTPDETEPSQTVTESTLPTDSTEPSSSETVPGDVTEPSTTETEPQTSTAKPTTPKKKYLKGDVDLDERVSVKDATLVQKFSADLSPLDNLQKLLANCDGTEGINVKDATLIQKYCAGFINQGNVGSEVFF